MHVMLSASGWISHTVEMCSQSAPLIKQLVLQICTKSAPLSIFIIILSAHIRRANQPLMWPQILPFLHYMHGSLLLQKILTTGWAVAALSLAGWYPSSSTSFSLMPPKSLKDKLVSLPEPQPQKYLFKSLSAVSRTPQNFYFILLFLRDITSSQYTEGSHMFCMRFYGTDAERVTALKMLASTSEAKGRSQAGTAQLEGSTIEAAGGNRQS